ncbi:hypothetical protein [Microbispora sp. CA-102843]|uniref:hypothetical protein n=1 Tax=Microbispora sp. CA-102843 TaxID=3239952 RepID=UPI003D8EB929
MAYATADDLIDYLDPVPDDAELRLVRASRVIARAIRTAVYDVDDDGQPTDQKVIDALREATCEQVAAWSEGGETGTGATPQYDNVSIGSVTLGGRKSGGSGGDRPAAEDLAPQARLALEEAGLLGTPLRSW